MNHSVQRSSYLVFQTHLAPERLAPFLEAASGNHRNAVRLYQWNIQLSGAVYEALHVFEVVFRNAIDVQICLWNAEQKNPQSGRNYSSDWLLNPAPLVQRLVGEQDLAKARARAMRAIKRHNRPLSHADLLAQMSFGTWRFLLPSRDQGRRYLWDQVIHKGFPYLKRSPKALVTSVDGVYQLRNRVAHLEPLLRSGNVRTQYDNMRSVLREISPPIEEWFVSNQRVTTELRNRPH